MENKQTGINKKLSKKLIITLIILGNFFVIALIGVTAYSVGYNQIRSTNNTSISTSTGTTTDPGKQTIIVTPTPDPTGTTEPFEIRPLVTSVVSFSHDSLITANKDQAIKNIQTAFDNIQTVNSIGYKYISSDGEEYGKSFTAKYQIDKKNAGYNYRLSDYFSWGFPDGNHNSPTKKINTEEGSNKNHLFGIY